MAEKCKIIVTGTIYLSIQIETKLKYRLIVLQAGFNPDWLIQNAKYVTVSRNLFNSYASFGKRKKIIRD